jgi:hypothetical protein
MTIRRVVGLLALLLATIPETVWAGDPSSGRREIPPAWRELRFSAHKAGISATIDLRLEPGSGQPADDVVLESMTHLPGRTFVARERVDAASAGAREIVDTETGAKHHRKTYTLAARGFRLELVEPASLSEMLLPPERWTRHCESFAAFPRALPPGATVTGPASLLYAASAAGLASPGDSMTIHVLVQTQVERVTVSVEGAEPVDLAFGENAGGRLTAVHEQVTALRLVARSQPVDPESASAFRIFGLDGDVQLLWDPGRRLPVEISGHVKMLGRVEVRLFSVTLR